ncbi:MAG: RecX family transcriptional regulator [Flavobacteriales bacterium]|nr:RecX family transcriptional regulator [Flavobacteriales bacterium]
MSFLKNELLSKLQHYCSYQERCHYEVEQKLYSLGCKKNTADEIIADLISSGFLNEQRFANAYAGGKFRTLNWGKTKITRKLAEKKVPAKIISEALRSIEESDYQKSLENLVKNHSSKLKTYSDKQKMIKFLMTKGFEYDRILEAIKTVQSY